MLEQEFESCRKYSQSCPIHRGEPRGKDLGKLKVFATYLFDVEESLSRWFVHRGHSQQGPLSSMDLRRALREGEVDPFTDVHHEANPNDVRPLLDWDEIFLPETEEASKLIHSERNYSVPSDDQNMSKVTPELQSKNNLNIRRLEETKIRLSGKGESRGPTSPLTGSTTTTIIGQTSLETTKVAIPNSDGLPSIKHSKNVDGPNPLKIRKDPQEKDLKPTLDKVHSSSTNVGSPAQREAPSRENQNNDRAFTVHFGTKKIGPCTAQEIIEAYRLGKIDQNYLVSQKHHDAKIGILKFIKIYDGNRKVSKLWKSLRRPQFSGKILAGVLTLGLLVIATLVMTYSGPSKKENPKREIVTQGSSQRTQNDGHRYPRLPFKKLPPIQPSSSSSSKGMSAKSMLKSSSIALTTRKKPNGSLVQLDNLFFDSAALRKCSSRCELMFMDQVGGAIQVILDVRVHRNRLQSARGRASIRGYISQGGKKLILKQVY